MHDNIKFTHLHYMYPAYNFDNKLYSSAIVKMKYFYITE